MRIKAIILISFIFLSILFLWLTGRLTIAAGNNIESEFTQVFFKSSVLLRSVIAFLIILLSLALSGMIYSKRKIANRNYFLGFLYATIYVAIIAGIFIYNLVKSF